MYRLPTDHSKSQQNERTSERSSGGSLLDQFDDGAAAPEANEPKESIPAQKANAAYSSQNTAIPPSDEHQDLRAVLAPLSGVGPFTVLQWLRRGWLLIALSMLVFAALALTYASLTPPRFTAYTDVVINPSNLNVVGDGVFTPAQQRETQILEVESKLRTLTSRNVLERTVVALKLDQDPEFTQPSRIEKLKSFWKTSPEGDNVIGALRSLGDRVSASRDARSFVVTLAVWSNDGEKSVEISKAIMNAFEEEILASSTDGSRRAVTDLNIRLEELRKNVTEAEQAVEEFRRDNSLQQVNGQLASDQASSELNAQVLSAQQRYIQEQSRFSQMETAIQQNRTATAAIFDSQTMNTIREQYSLLQQQIGAMTQTYGARHPRLASAGAERLMLEQGMLNEAQRILEMARSSVEEAKASFDALKTQANSEQARVFSNNETLVTLRDLERNARSVAAIYETYLTRARQITEQQAIDVNNMRVISQPIAPNYRSWPPSKAVFLIGGLIIGAVIGAFLAMALGALSLVKRRSTV